MELWLAGLLVLVLSGFGAANYQLERGAQFTRMDNDLALRVAALNNALRNAPFSRRMQRPNGPPDGPPPSDDFARGDMSRRPAPDSPPDGPPPDGPRHLGPREPGDFSLPSATEALFGEGVASFYYVIWYRDGSELGRSANAPKDVPPPPGVLYDTLTHWQTRAGNREAVHCSGLGDCALAGRSEAADLAAMRLFLWKLLFAGITVLTVALGAGWWLTGRAIRPIEEISHAANRIAGGNLSERVAVSDDSSELGLLAAVLNRTFARLEAAFARQRQFTADAAHELRTPLAVIISETQTALASPRSAEEYKEIVEGCLDTAQQMRRLTESLLTLSRFDGNEAPATRTVLDVSDAVRRAVERVRPLAESKSVSIASDLLPVWTYMNQDRLGQVVNNLVANAIAYNKPGGEVWLSTREEPGSAILTVRDTGVGVAASDLPYIFDRFFRADKSRSSAEGHAGLGLAICRAIVEAEGGKIEATSTFGIGSIFTVRFVSR